MAASVWSRFGINLENESKLNRKGRDSRSKMFHEMAIFICCAVQLLQAYCLELIQFITSSNFINHFHLWSCAACNDEWILPQGFSTEFSKIFSYLRTQIWRAASKVKIVLWYNRRKSRIYYYYYYYYYYHYYSVFTFFQGCL